MQVSELALLDDVQKVVVPFGDGRNWICPNCEARLSVVAEGQDRLHALFLGKPPKYAHLLNDIIRCTGDAGCGFIFSPRSEAIVLRR